MIDVNAFLEKMVEMNSSDLFLKAGRPPSYKIAGIITQVDDQALSPGDMEEVADFLLSDEQHKEFQSKCELDFGYGVSGVGRFRINMFMQRGTIGLVARSVKTPDLSFEELNLPPSIKKLAEEHRGLVLVTGTTGSGKSTTLATMINYINSMRPCHIMTIEDPIEFIHRDNKAIVNQREVGLDTSSFGEGLKRVLRQAPDVILIGEMRDLETITTAISAAETGHLVFSTLHTTDATQTIDRIINYYPAYLHNQIRMELSLTMKGIISQRLLKTADGKGLIPATEIMIATPSIRKLLSEGKTGQILGFIQDGEHYGMQSFNQALVKLYKEGRITFEEAMDHATSPDEFKLNIQGIYSGVQSKDMI